MTEPQVQATEATEAPAAPKIKTTIRRAKIDDIPALVDMCMESALIQINHGNQLFSSDPAVLKGGFVIEIGMHFHNPMARMLVAQRQGELVGYMIASLEDCGPAEKHLRRVRIWGDYIRPALDSLRRPLVLLTMWEEIRKWSISMGAGYGIAFIHPGNTPSIRSAKRVGFKHHLTQFVNLFDGGSGNGLRRTE